MKKQNLFFLIIAVGCLVCSCGNKVKNMTLTVNNLSSNEDFYIFDPTNEFGEPIDTIKVENNAINKVFDKPIYAEGNKLLVLMNNRYTKLFISEKAALTIENIDSTYVDGGSFNKELNQFFLKYDEIEKKYSETIKSLPEDDEAGYKEIVGNMRVELSSFIKESLKKHSNSMLGVVEMYKLVSLVSGQEFIDVYEGLGESVKEHALIQNIYKNISNSLKTQEGHKFVDFEIVDVKDLDKTVKLSDYLGKGKYTLLDFWASWCSPCKKAIPTLKELNSKYSDKMDIIGVLVWEEKIEDHYRVAKDFAISWTQLYDKKHKEIAELYGIDGIPTMILLDEDGMIICRTSDKEVILNKIQETVAKK